MVKNQKGLMANLKPIWSPIWWNHNYFLQGHPEKTIAN